MKYGTTKWHWHCRSRDNEKVVNSDIMMVPIFLFGSNLEMPYGRLHFVAICKCLRLLFVPNWIWKCLMADCHKAFLDWNTKESCERI